LCCRCSTSGYTPILLPCTKPNSKSMRRPRTTPGMHVDRSKMQQGTSFQFSSSSFLRGPFQHQPGCLFPTPFPPCGLVHERQHPPHNPRFHCLFLLRNWDQCPRQTRKYSASRLPVGQAVARTVPTAPRPGSFRVVGAFSVRNTPTPTCSGAPARPSGAFADRRIVQ
jgi:hypothetical protein